MQVFVRVAEAGGFAEAARQLNMSPPAVSGGSRSLWDPLQRIAVMGKIEFTAPDGSSAAML